MQMLYHSDHFLVVQIEVPTADGGALAGGGYEIVDKFAKRGIFLQGAAAEAFREGVQQLVREAGQEPEAIDDFLETYAGAAAQPVSLH